MQTSHLVAHDDGPPLQHLLSHRPGPLGQSEYRSGVLIDLSMFERVAIDPLGPMSPTGW
jgi:hypothetical protein